MSSGELIEVTEVMETSHRSVAECARRVLAEAIDTSHTLGGRSQAEESKIWDLN